MEGNGTTQASVDELIAARLDQSGPSDLAADLVLASLLGDDDLDAVLSGTSPAGDRPPQLGPATDIPPGELYLRSDRSRGLPRHWPKGGAATATRSGPDCRRGPQRVRQVEPRRSCRDRFDGRQQALVRSHSGVARRLAQPAHDRRIPDRRGTDRRRPGRRTAGHARVATRCQPGWRRVLGAAARCVPTAAEHDELVGTARGVPALSVIFRARGAGQRQAERHVRRPCRRSSAWTARRRGEPAHDTPSGSTSPARRPIRQLPRLVSGSRTSGQPARPALERRAPPTLES